MGIYNIEIGKPQKIIRKDPTIIPVKIVPPKKTPSKPAPQPQERPIPAPNWPTKRPADVPR